MTRDGVDSAERPWENELGQEKATCKVPHSPFLNLSNLTIGVQSGYSWESEGLRVFWLVPFMQWEGAIRFPFGVSDSQCPGHA